MSINNDSKSPSVSVVNPFSSFTELMKVTLAKTIPLSTSIAAPSTIVPTPAPAPVAAPASAAAATSALAAALASSSSIVPTRARSGTLPPTTVHTLSDRQVRQLQINTNAEIRALFSVRRPQLDTVENPKLPTTVQQMLYDYIMCDSEYARGMLIGKWRSNPDTAAHLPKFLDATNFQVAHAYSPAYFIREWVKSEADFTPEVLEQVVNHADASGSRPLHYIVGTYEPDTAENRDTAELLISYGARVNLQDFMGMTPYDAALGELAARAQLVMEQRQKTGIVATLPPATELPSFNPDGSVEIGRKRNTLESILFEGLRAQKNLPKLPSPPPVAPKPAAAAPKTVLKNAIRVAQAASAALSTRLPTRLPTIPENGFSTVVL